MSKGEATAEIARGLKATAHAIDVVHKAMRQYNITDLYDAEALEQQALRGDGTTKLPGYTWFPLSTMNDDSNALRNAWDDLLWHQLAPLAEAMQL